MEKILNKRRILLQKKEENMRHIRDLGSLPVDAAEKYKDKSEAQLYKKLKTAAGKKTLMSMIGGKNTPSLHPFTSLSLYCHVASRAKKHVSQDVSGIAPVMHARCIKM